MFMYILGCNFEDVEYDDGEIFYQICDEMICSNGEVHSTGESDPTCKYNVQIKCN